MRRRIHRVGALLALTVTLLLSQAGLAAAHVIIDSADPVGDGTVVLTFSFDHSCANSPTTALSMQMPDGSVALDASPPSGWTETITGNEIQWSGPGIATGTTVTFTVTARLAGQVGQPLLFPTVQRCADGDGYDWVQADESANDPAPRLIATAAVLDPALAGASSGQGEADVGALTVTIALVAFAAVAYLAAGAHRRSRPRPQ